MCAHRWWAPSWCVAAVTPLLASFFSSCQAESFLKSKFIQMSKIIREDFPAMSSDARPCPTCQTGSISSGDLHAKCEAACPFCTALPVAEKVRRVEYFTPSTDEEIPVAGTYSLDKALRFFNVGQEPAGSYRLDDVIDSEEYDEAGCHSPSSLLYITEVDELRSAGNNIALLAFGVSKMVEELDAPDESKTIITKTADAILNLCAAVLTGSARIAAWQTLIQRALWLKALPSIPEHLHREMLEGHITSDVLFGPHLTSVIERAQTGAELSATVRDLVHSRSASHSSRSPRGWDERRGIFKRPAAPPAPRGRPPASAPHQRDQRDGGQRFRRGQQTPSWQSQVHEPRRKQPRK
uniref:Uncharacterized protein n=1 Tax=Nothobranchius pienaari TaxID=704102 RepID=A0A1A8MZV8_9TELE